MKVSNLKANPNHREHPAVITPQLTKPILILASDRYFFFSTVRNNAHQGNDCTLMCWLCTKQLSIAPLHKLVTNNFQTLNIENSSQKASITDEFNDCTRTSFHRVQFSKQSIRMRCFVHRLAITHRTLKRQNRLRKTSSFQDIDWIAYCTQIAANCMKKQR